MAFEEQIGWLKSGEFQRWNEWKKQNYFDKLVVENTEFRMIEALGVDFSNIWFDNCKFSESKFNFCNFSDAEFSDSYFNNVNFTKCIFRNLGVNDWMSFGDGQTPFETSDIYDSTFYEARFWDQHTPKIDSLQYEDQTSERRIEVNSLGDFLESNEFHRFSEAQHIYFRGEGNKDFKLEPSFSRTKNLRNSKIYQNEDEILQALMIKQPDAFASDHTHFAKLATARHYGLPSRLLDVTRNPLVAFFNAVGQDGDKNADKDGIVHVFLPEQRLVKTFNSDTVAMLANYTRLKHNRKSAFLKGTYTQDFRGELLKLIREDKPNFEERYELGDFLLPIFVEPQQKFPRVRAQSGAFLMSAFHERFEQSEILKVNPHIPCYDYLRIIIPSDAKPRIRQELKMLNVTHDVLMADMDSAAQAVKAMYS